MRKKTKEKLCRSIILIVIIVLAAITSYFLDFSNKVDNKNNSKIEENNVSSDNITNSSVGIEPKLQIHYIDVGQADAILIKQGEHAMVIDAGKNDTEDMVVSYLNDQGINKLDYAIGTHVHEDHIGGMDKVVESFKIDNILFPKQVSTTKAFERFVIAVKNKNMQLYAPKVGEKFEFGEASFQIIAPNSDLYKEANDYSIVVKLTYKNKSFLFMGDAESTSEEEILNNGLDIKCNVLKIGHHGSKTSTFKKFLEKASPDVAVLTTGKDNDYKHPAKKTMNRLQERNIPVYRTDESGTIVLNCDGENIYFNVKEGTYNYGK